MYDFDDLNSPVSFCGGGGGEGGGGGGYGVCTASDPYGRGSSGGGRNSNPRGTNGLQQTGSYVNDLDVTNNGHLGDEVVSAIGMVTGGALGVGLGVAGLIAGSNGADNGTTRGRNKGR